METAEKDTLSFTGTESVNFTKARTSGTSHTQGKHRTHMNSKKYSMHLLGRVHNATGVAMHILQTNVNLKVQSAINVGKLVI